MSIKFKKPWLFAEYQDMMRTLDEGEMYNEGVNERQSEFKKPYRAATHPNSENAFSGPGGVGSGGPGGGGGGGAGGSGYPTGGNWPGSDCMPAGSAIGGGALNPCQPGLSCGQWTWTCAHKITKFNVAQTNGFIQSVKYGANDTVTVTVCWDENFRGSGKVAGSLVTTANGAVFKATVPLDCLGPGHDNNCTNCQDCVGAGHVPVVQHTSNQMNLSATQTFTVAGGGGGPYLWSIIAGGGTLSGGSGSTIVYTAPASNANCAKNPTIRVKDYCGNIKDTKLAINNPSASGVAYHQFVREGVLTNPGNCGNIVVKRYACGGTTWYSQDYCSRCYGHVCGGNNICTVPQFDCTPVCSWAGLEAACYSTGDCTGDCRERVIDKRTSDVLLAGCCPAALIV